MSNGEVLQGLIRILTSLGYTTDYRVLNALDFGLPQRRERVFIVATLNAFDAFPWPTGTVAKTPLADVLEPNPPSKYNLPDEKRERILREYSADTYPSMFKRAYTGGISSIRPYASTVTAGGSHDQYVNGTRRLTPLEALRLQGFPSSFEIICLSLIHI